MTKLLSLLNKYIKAQPKYLIKMENYPYPYHTQNIYMQKTNMNSPALRRTLAQS